MSDPQRDTADMLASLNMQVDDLHRTIREKQVLRREDLNGVEFVLYEILAEQKKTTDAVLRVGMALGILLLIAFVVTFLAVAAGR